MSKDFYCPMCRAFQKQVDLEETDNTFICSNCKSEIHFDKWSEDNKEIEFTVITTDE